MGGDLNDIHTNSEKKGGRPRAESSFHMYRHFVSQLNMADLQFSGRKWTWSNNREGDDFVEERLDRFFASPDWLYHHPKARVQHISKFASDHCFLVLDDQAPSHHQARRFFFDKRMLELPDFEKTVVQGWMSATEGTQMFQVCEKIKSCRLELLKLSKLHQMNSSRVIQEL